MGLKYVLLLFGSLYERGQKSLEFKNENTKTATTMINKKIRITKKKESKTGETN